MAASFAVVSLQTFKDASEVVFTVVCSGGPRLSIAFAPYRV